MNETALKPLSDAEKARVAANVELVQAIHPEMGDSIKALRAAGFDVGWRHVTYVGPHRAESPNSVHAGQMVLESNEALKARLAREAKQHGNH